MKAQLHVDEQRDAWRTLDTIPFESRNRFMATLHRTPDVQESDGVAFVKGGPEHVLAMCERQADGEVAQPIDTASWREQAAIMASRGQGLLAVARKSAARRSHPRSQALPRRRHPRRHDHW